MTENKVLMTTHNKLHTQVKPKTIKYAKLVTKSKGRVKMGMPNDLMLDKLLKKLKKHKKAIKKA